MTIIVRVIPHVSLQNTHVSTRAGIIKPSVDKHNAPINDMNKSNFGIATASKTVGREKNIFFFF